jgi:multimeric flavodoxin WrbA
MNLLIISASPRGDRSQTLILARETARGCGSDGSVTTIKLCDFKIEYCRHCESCHKKILNCPIKDDAGEILKHMLAADGIILATPNYINQVAAPMKALFDRSTHFIHCLRLGGKYVVGVVSSGSGYDAPVLDYLKHYAHACGAQYSGSVSSKASDVQLKLKDAFDLGKKLAQDIKEKKTYSDQQKVIEENRKHFKQLICARKDDWPGEYDFWKEHSWL